MYYADLMRGVEFVEVRCKAALNRVQGMPFRWSVNPYVGCTHACHYCYARAYYAIAERGDAGRDFETRIFVKVNLPEVLAQELARPAWRREAVALGTATDCYQPAEARYGLTRRVLGVLLDHRNGASVVTKAPLVLRDLDLWTALARVAPVRVLVTITTLDPALWRQVEPGTPNPRKRLEVVARLSAAGVPVGVLLAPVLPGLTDSAAAIEQVAAAAAAHGATYFGAGPLRLPPFVREHYLAFLARTRPELVAWYQRQYVGTYPSRAYLAQLEARLAAVRARHGFGDPAGAARPAAEPTAVMAAGPQLALPL